MLTNEIDAGFLLFQMIELLSLNWCARSVFKLPLHTAIYQVYLSS